MKASNERIAALQRRILTWYAEHGRDLPWRHTTNPYRILVSEVMLQQTQVSRVVHKYAEFLTALPTLEALAAAPLAEVLRLWSGLGYNNRARRLQGCARAAVKHCAPGPAELPRTLPELLALPGVGPYTGRAVLIFAHNDDLAAVDANVRRVLTVELELDEDIGAAALQEAADAALPRGRSRDWHNALMDYGTAVHTSRATGLRPRTRQSSFVGSRRWYRSQLLQACLREGPQRLSHLATRLDLPLAQVEELVELLERDGLLRRRGAAVEVAELNVPPATPS